MTVMTPTQLTWHSVVETELGPLTATRDEAGITGLYFPGHWTRPDRATWGPLQDNGFDNLRTELGEFLAGSRREFTVPISLHGTPFQQQAWALLRQIPYGDTTTYGALSGRLGSASAHPRAVGHAVGHNPVSILVPCHRVVGSTGSLTGYAGGLERKRHLLTLEGALAAGAGAVSTSGAPTLF